MDCVFCKIIKNEIPSGKVYEDEDLVVFHDIHPKARINLLIVPKKHIISVASANGDDRELLGKLFLTAKYLGEMEGISDRGYKLIVNTGAEGGQLVPHLHMHFLGGEKISEDALQNNFGKE